MFGIGMTELMVILVVALLVFGPKRLPELARSLGRGLAEFRRASSDLHRSLLDEDDAPRRMEPPEARQAVAGAARPEGHPKAAPTTEAQSSPRPAGADSGASGEAAPAQAPTNAPASERSGG